MHRSFHAICAGCQSHSKPVARFQDPPKWKLCLKETGKTGRTKRFFSFYLCPRCKKKPSYIPRWRIPEEFEPLIITVTEICGICGHQESHEEKGNPAKFAGWTKITIGDNGSTRALMLCPGCSTKSQTIIVPVTPPLPSKA